MVLVQRIERGDDRICMYEVVFGSRTMYYTVGLAPDDRVLVFPGDGEKGDPVLQRGLELVRGAAVVRRAA